MLLNECLSDGRLKPQPANHAEIARLLAVADRDLADANVRGVSIDRRFATAYNAALQLATVVLRASGYRTSSAAAGHHWVTLALLPELMGPEQADRRSFLDSCRRARNQADYDRIDVVSKQDLAELLTDTLAFRDETLTWLRREHPELV
jgi:hypothetical protein